MNYEVVPAFSVPIGIAKVDHELCEPIKNFKGIAQGVKGLDFNVLDKAPEIKQELIKIFTDFMNLHVLNSSEQEYTITTSWITENNSGASMTRHNHKNSFYSSVLYFDEVTQDHPPLLFENPFNNSGFYIEIKNPNQFTGETFTAPIAKGLILFFPSYMFHFHQPFMPTNISRKSLACNYIPIGKYGISDSSFDTRKIHE